MTRCDALTVAISALTADTYPNPNYTEGKTNIRKEFPAAEVRVVLTRIRDTLSKERSAEAKAKTSEARKAKTAAFRAVLVDMVAPVLRKYLTNDITAKELFEMAKDELPADFSAPKVQNILLREMASELVKTEVKGKANTYRLAE